VCFALLLRAYRALRHNTPLSIHHDPHPAPQIAPRASSFRASLVKPALCANLFKPEDTFKPSCFVSGASADITAHRPLSLTAVLTSTPVARPAVFTGPICDVSCPALIALLARAADGIQRFPRDAPTTAPRRAHAACQHDSQGQGALTAVQYRRERHDFSLGFPSALPAVRNPLSSRKRSWMISA
jgi:hypothetical protein